MFKETPSPATRPEKVNAKKSEHLKEGVNPIMACVGIPDQFKREDGGEASSTFFKAITDRILKKNKEPGTNRFGVSNDRQNRNADYYGKPKKLQRENFINPQKNSYVISPVDSLDKSSETFRNCTGVIATGKHKDTGENISVLSHEDPNYFLEHQDQFGADLKERLQELKEQSEEGTIDAVILGGNSFEKERKGVKVDYKKDPQDSFTQAYFESIDLLAKEVVDALGFEPVVITGPKTVGGEDNIYYDNEHRRLFIERPVIGRGSTESYLPREIRKQRKKW